MVPRSPASVTVPPASEASLQTPSIEGSVSIRGFLPVSGSQAASFSRALALIIAAPFSAIMIVGALVGPGGASMSRQVSGGLRQPLTASPEKIDSAPQRRQPQLWTPLARDERCCPLLKSLRA